MRIRPGDASTIVIAVLAVSAAACGLPSPAGYEPKTSASPTPELTLPPEPVRLRRVCTDQPGFSALPAYTRIKGAKHKIAYLFYGGIWQIDNFPPDTPAGAWYTKGSATDVDLVLCRDRVSATPSKTTCEMTEMGGEKKPVTITLYDTTWRMQLREARTGKSLLDRQVKTRAGKCEWSYLSYTEEEKTRHYVEPTDETLAALVAPFVTH